MLRYALTYALVTIASFFGGLVGLIYGSYKTLQEADMPPIRKAMMMVFFLIMVLPLTTFHLAQYIRAGEIAAGVSKLKKTL